MKKSGALILVVVIGALLALAWWLLNDAKLDVLLPAGSIAEEQRSLMIVATVLSALVVVPVFTLLIIFSVWYREGNDKAEYNPHLTHNNTLEALWWGIPIAIIGILAVITWHTSHTLDPYRPIVSDNEPIRVDVVALQWKWLFIYPEHDVASVNKLVVPVDTPIDFHLTADAPMSAFWIPSLGSQIYTMNGMTSRLHLIANQTGEYKGYNTNINGRGYADMDFTVQATSNSDFLAWRDKVATSAKLLSWSEYKLLSSPETQVDTETYRLVDASLLHTIQMQFMPSHNHGGTH